MTEAPMSPDDGKIFAVTSSVSGHAHYRIEGTYTGPVTVADVRERYFHPYLGGRDAWVKDGRFGCVIHTD